MAMAAEKSALQRAHHYGAKRSQKIFENLNKDNLWKRILKNVIATTAAGMESPIVFEEYSNRS